MSTTKGIVFTIAAASFALAQTSSRPEFEVASIRPSTSTPQGQVSVGVHIDGAQVRIAALSLKDYIGLAYRTKVSNIFGPDWISSDRFDISATIPAGGKTTQIPEMFQSLLADRFQLKFHREKREFPVYALLIGKGELKLKEVPPDSDQGDKEKEPPPINVSGGGSAAGVSLNLGNGSSWSFVPNRFEAKKLTMEQFAANLERFADRPIVDMTGLKGQYDLGFDINPEDYRPMLIRSAISAGATLPPQALRLLDGTSSASLSDALQPIGLRLETRKAPLDVIVVDDAKKTPTGN
jgi:uncharacterized protein (TIGR03435 family)